MEAHGHSMHCTYPNNLTTQHYTTVILRIACDKWMRLCQPKSKVAALSHGLLVVESKNSTLLARYHKVGVVFVNLARVTYREVVFLLVEHAYS